MNILIERQEAEYGYIYRAFELVRLQRINGDVHTYAYPLGLADVDRDVLEATLTARYGDVNYEYYP